MDNIVLYALLKKYISEVSGDYVTEDDVTSIIAESIANGAIKNAINSAVEDSLKVKTS